MQLAALLRLNTNSLRCNEESLCKFSSRNLSRPDRRFSIEAEASRMMVAARNDDNRRAAIRVTVARNFSTSEQWKKDDFG